MIIEHGLLPGHVLQRAPRGARAAITGTCNACGDVYVTVYKGSRALPGLKAIRVGNASDGRFSALLTGLPAGGPYTVELACNTERLKVKDVFVGDLWLMAGQSNMEGIGNMVDAPKPHPLVRNFNMARCWEMARDPLHLLGESPDKAHTALTMTPAQAAKIKRTALKGVGVGVWFGKIMQARSRVPQGLIATAHGGTSMAQWDPALKDKGGNSLYGSMWLSLQAVGQPIAGVLWYQGCSDTGAADAAVYTRKMQELVAAVRRDLRQPKLPWIIVQIGRAIEQNDDPRGWNSVQEQQRRLPETIPYCDVVPTVDLELDDQIHISGKSHAILARRMARVAARLVLGDKKVKPAIQPISAQMQDSKLPTNIAVVVRFANVVGKLTAQGGFPQGFQLVDKNQKPRWGIYKTTLKDNCAVLHLASPDTSHIRVVYGLGNNPVCNITDSQGMSLPVFGPMPITGLPALSPCFNRWKVTAVLPGEDIAAVPRPAADDPSAIDRTYVCTQYPNFVNNHEEWMGRTGHVGFSGYVDIPEDAEVEIRAGYDGPFRLWVGDREVMTDLQGTNPALMDAKRVRVKLTKGRQPVTVLMAINNGQAWGFFLRMALPGKKAAENLPVPLPWE